MLLILKFIIYISISLFGYFLPKWLSKLDEVYKLKSNIYISFLSNLPVLIFFYSLNDWKSLLAMTFIMLTVSIEYSAAIMDKLYRNVYDIIHYLAMITTLPIFFIYKVSPVSVIPFIISVFLFWLIKGYAFSDTLAFIVLGLLMNDWFVALKINYTTYSYLLYSLTLMLIIVLIFIAIQLFKGNMSIYGKPKKETALIPYIWIGMIFACLFFTKFVFLPLL